MRVVERGEDLPLGAEAAQRVGVPERHVDQLDGDPLDELAVHALGAVDDAHPPSPIFSTSGTGQRFGRARPGTPPDRPSATPAPWRGRGSRPSFRGPLSAIRPRPAARGVPRSDRSGSSRAERGGAARRPRRAPEDRPQDRSPPPSWPRPRQPGVSFNARYSQARANVQCRFTVAGATSGTPPSRRWTGRRNSEARRPSPVAAATAVSRSSASSSATRSSRRSTPCSDESSRSIPRHRLIALQGAPLPRVVHQDPPHGLRRRPVEVSPVVEAGVANAGQPQIGLVHQGRRLKGVIRTLPAHVMCGQPAQLVVDQRHQRFEGRGVSGVPAGQQLGHVRHGRVHLRAISGR